MGSLFTCGRGLKMDLKASRNSVSLSSSFWLMSGVCAFCMMAARMSVSRIFNFTGAARRFKVLFPIGILHSLLA